MADSNAASASLRLNIDRSTNDLDRARPSAIADDLRRALEAVAIDATEEVRVISAVLAALGLDADVLLDLEAASAIEFVDDRIALAKGSQRTAIVAAMTPADRRSLHRAFAGVLSEPRYRVLTAEHLASSAVGPDAEASAAFAALAAEATERGGAAMAGELFTRAGGFAATAQERAQLLYHAGDGFWNAGQYDDARAAFDAATNGTTEPLLRADIAWQLGQLEMYQRGPRYSRDLFVAAAEAVEPYDIDRAAILLVHAASTALMTSDIVGSLPIARRACVLAESGNGSSALPASLMFAFLCMHHGDVEEFDRRFPEIQQVADVLKDSDIAEADLFLQLVGMVHVYTEQWDTGRVYLNAVAHRAGRRARFATTALARATLAELCWRSGRWDEAWALATSDVVTEVRLTGARIWLTAFTAHLDAGFGREEDCRARAAAALAESEPMIIDTASMWANYSLGLLELGLGHSAEAAAHLDLVDAMVTAYEWVEPGGLWWQADHVEALARSGRRREAARALSRFEAAAAISDRAWPSAMAARCRALMALTTEEAEQWFATALAHHERLTAPFELARTLFCRAERRAVTKAGLDVTGDLAEATAIFDALGATSWSDRCGEMREALSSNPEALLSPAELRIVHAVVAGLSNREVAASLFISEKTVEFHLYKVYRKLGVHSRTQLSRLLSSPSV